MTVLEKNAFDAKDEGETVDTSIRSPRPKDAATLILVRRDHEKPRVLVGRRSGRHDFMPDKFVFPGGRVEPFDGRVPAVSELKETEVAKLKFMTRRIPRSFPLTAIRETFEETGLIVGQPGTVEGKIPKNWEEYFSQGAVPCLSHFRFIGRAITPPYRPKRFDARFFFGFAEDTLIDERPPVDGAELLDLQWPTFDEAVELNLPSVTRYMLEEIEKRLKNPDKSINPPFVRWTRTGHATDRIQ